MHQALPIQCKVALTIKEAAEYSNIGINKLESLLRSPRCPFVLYVGKKKLVKRKEFEKFISDNVEI
ncbi:MAG: excisionase [Coprococcus comes]|uniref:excisionase n=1 Tax=Coprococcus comes TaxID=410072 RepID=UPI001898BAC7